MALEGTGLPGCEVQSALNDCIPHYTRTYLNLLLCAIKTSDPGGNNPPFVAAGKGLANLSMYSCSLSAKSFPRKMIFTAPCRATKRRKT